MGLCPLACAGIVIINRQSFVNYNKSVRKARVADELVLMVSMAITYVKHLGNDKMHESSTSKIPEFLSPSACSMCS